MKTLKRLLSLAIAVAVGFAVFAGVGFAGLFGISNPFKTETIDRSQPALLKSIQDISEFHGAVGNFEVVLDIEDDVNNLPDFLAGERTLFVAAGTVDGYVDFSSLGNGDLTLSEDGTSVEIRLPEAELGEPNLDQDRTYMFDQDRGLINRLDDAFSVSDQSDFYQRAEEKMVKAAEESELAQQARENTKAMLVGMFTPLDFEVSFIEEPLAE